MLRRIMTLQDKTQKKLEEVFPLVDKRDREGILPVETKMLCRSILGRSFDKIVNEKKLNLPVAEVVNAAAEVVDAVIESIDYLNIDSNSSLVGDVFNTISLYNASKLVKPLEIYGSVSTELLGKIETTAEACNIDIEGGALLTGRDKVQNLLNAFENPLSIVSDQALDLRLTRNNAYRKVAVKTLDDIYSITSKLAENNDEAKIFTSKVLVTAYDAGIFVAGKMPAKVKEETNSLLEDVVRTSKYFDLRKEALSLRNQISEVKINPYKQIEDFYRGGGLGL